MAVYGSTENFDHCCEPCLTTRHRIEAHMLCVTCEEYLCSNCTDFHRISGHHNILRITVDLVGSIAAGSEEYFDLCCKQCLTKRQRKEAQGFCVTCQEYLCSTCLNYHRKAPNFRNHNILNNVKLDKFEKRQQLCDNCIDECAVHRHKIMRFYCRSHNVLGCSHCMVICHRACEVGDIPCTCSSIADSKEFDDVMKKLSEWLKRAEIIDECPVFISKIQNLQSRLTVGKSNLQHKHLFINMKRAESLLNSDELNNAEKALRNALMQNPLDRKADLEKIWSQKMVIGKMSNHFRYDFPNLMIGKGDINVKTSLDEVNCYITGCAVINTNTLVLADNNNKKVKLFSIENRIVYVEKVLESYPWDITVISQDQFAVTIPGIEEIVIMTTNENMSYVRRITMHRKCYGIDFNQDCLYVVCLSLPGVIVLSTHGDILSNIPLNFLSPFNIPYIAVRNDSKVLFISDFENNCVVCVFFKWGSYTTIHTQTDLKGPRGMLMLDDRSLLVCCSGDGTIYKINGALKKEVITMCKDKGPLHSICYNSFYNEFYVVGRGNRLIIC